MADFRLCRAPRPRRSNASGLRYRTTWGAQRETFEVTWLAASRMPMPARAADDPGADHGQHAVVDAEVEVEGGGALGIGSFALTGR